MTDTWIRSKRSHFVFMKLFESSISECGLFIVQKSPPTRGALVAVGCSPPYTFHCFYLARFCYMNFAGTSSAFICRWIENILLFSNETFAYLILTFKSPSVWAVKITIFSGLLAHYYVSSDLPPSSAFGFLTIRKSLYGAAPTCRTFPSFDSSGSFTSNYQSSRKAVAFQSHFCVPCAPCRFCPRSVSCDRLGRYVDANELWWSLLNTIHKSNGCRRRVAQSLANQNFKGREVGFQTVTEMKHID